MQPQAKGREWGKKMVHCPFVAQQKQRLGLRVAVPILMMTRQRCSLHGVGLAGVMAVRFPVGMANKPID